MTWGALCGASGRQRADADSRIMNDERENLAFSGAAASESVDAGSALIVATRRSPFRTADGTATLNVECFEGAPSPVDDGGSSSSSPPPAGTDRPALLFVHGICESAETWSVQRLAVAARTSRCRLYVLELEGHGLSSGRSAVCGDFLRLVGHVVEFARHVLSIAAAPNGADGGAPAPFALCGTSLGGVLAAYASDIIAKSVEEDDRVSDATSQPRGEMAFRSFLGAALVSPAVGVNPDAVPPCAVVSGLRLLSTVAPSAGLLTPVEDPSHYACPASSMRNFSGHWPLATSRMLLDVTSKTVRRDQEDGTLALDVPSLLVLAGEKDELVPAEAVEDFVYRSKAKDKILVKVPGGDHGLLLAAETAAFVIDHIFKWLDDQKKTSQK